MVRFCFATGAAGSVRVGHARNPSAGSTDEGDAALLLRIGESDPARNGATSEAASALVRDPTGWRFDEAL
jgi:hypothetical protein